jgi:hypothetical protein
MDDRHQVKADLAGSFGPVIKHGLTVGFAVPIVMSAFIVSAHLEDPQDWIPPSLRAWLLLLSGGVAVGFVPAFSGAIWKSYFPRAAKEDDGASEKKA